MGKRPDSSVSDLNFLPVVTVGRAIKQDLIIADDTLREGEQAGEVSFSPDDKVRLAEKLSEVGVKHIQIGFAGKVAADREVIKRLKARGIKAELETVVLVFEPGWREQVERIGDSGADIVSLVYPVSDLRLTYGQKVSREQMLDIAVEAVRHAKGRGVLVRFAPSDTTRADLEFLKRLCRTVVEEGAKTVSISDTSGSMIPAAMGFLVREIVAVAGDAAVQVHCHNDFGLAVANSLAAVDAGANIVDTTVNGLGERTGNAPLAELVAALEYLYGVDTGIDTTRLTELSRMVEEMTGVDSQKTKPIVGEHAFAHKLDAHVRGTIAYPRLYEVIDPGWVGNVAAVVLGKGSGPHGVRHRLKELGIEVNDQQVANLVQAVEETAAANHASVTNAQLRELASRVIGANA